MARFANKNVIALGLGCSASGPLVLALQLALLIGPEPTQRQQVRGLSGMHSWLALLSCSQGCWQLCC